MNKDAKTKHDMLKRKLHSKGILELTPKESDEYVRLERLEELRKRREERKPNS